MDTVAVFDESECQLKCIENNSCKSVNVHPDSNNAQRRICQLNNKSGQMITKPGDFKWKPERFCILWICSGQLN